MTKTEASNKLRGKWLKMMAEHGNHGWCEMCGRSFGVGQAHRMKRRKMPSWKKDREAWEKEMGIAAYLCVSCHQELEYGDPDKMFNVITKIHENR